MHYPHRNPYDFGQESTDPNARPHKPALFEGDYPPADAQKEPYPDAGYTIDEHQAEQNLRRETLQEEGGTIGGPSPHYPDRAHPDSEEQSRAEQERQEYLRACHGGLPDAPGEAKAVGKRPFKGLKG